MEEHRSLSHTTKQKECGIEEGHLLADHVHMLLSVPPKSAVSAVVGFLKGNLLFPLARRHRSETFPKKLRTARRAIPTL